jgi:hypothetical protein
MTTKASKPDSLQSTALPTANAALQGASLAFGKPPVKPKPNVNNYSGTNAALAAARGSHSRSASSSRLDASERLAHQRSGGSTASGYTVEVERPRPSRLASGNGSLQLPDQSKSPSFIAAALAASRSVTPNHTGQQLSSTAVRVSEKSELERKFEPSFRYHTYTTDYLFNFHVRTECFREATVREEETYHQEINHVCHSSS